MSRTVAYWLFRLHVTPVVRTIVVCVPGLGALWLVGARGAVLLGLSAVVATLLLALDVASWRRRRDGRSADELASLLAANLTTRRMRDA